MNGSSGDERISCYVRAIISDLYSYFVFRCGYFQVKCVFESIRSIFTLTISQQASSYEWARELNHNPHILKHNHIIKWMILLCSYVLCKAFTLNEKVQQKNRDDDVKLRDNCELCASAGAHRQEHIHKIIKIF